MCASLTVLGHRFIGRPRKSTKISLGGFLRVTREELHRTHPYSRSHHAPSYERCSITRQPRRFNEIHDDERRVDAAPPSGKQCIVDQATILQVGRLIGPFGFKLLQKGPPLFLATSNGHEAAVRILLGCGADPRTETWLPNCPSMSPAEEVRHPSFVSYLMQA